MVRLRLLNVRRQWQIAARRNSVPLTEGLGADRDDTALSKTWRSAEPLWCLTFDGRGGPLAGRPLD